MVMEARFKTGDGERIYRTGLSEIVRGEDGLHLAFAEANSGSGGRQALTGEGEFLEEAVIEVVKLEGGQSIQEQDSLVEEFQENPKAFNQKHKADK